MRTLRVLAMLCIGALPASAAQTPPAPQPDQAEVVECVSRCPEGVEPPRFTFFPRLELRDSDASVRGRRNRTYLVFQGVVGADGVLEPETMVVSGGTARRLADELRRGLSQARFTPGRRDGTAVRARVALRFDFEAEGTSWVKYTYRVTAR